MQGGDGVIGDHVHAGPVFYQLLQLQDLPLPGGFVDRCPVSPEVWREKEM